MQKELQDLLDQIKDKTFSGISSYYPPNSPNSWLKFEYSPGKLVVKNKSVLYPFEVVNEVLFNKNFDVIAFAEIGDGKHHDYSSDEIKQIKRLGILFGRFWKNDPRYVIKIGKNFKKLSTDVYQVQIWQESFRRKKITVYAELHLDKGVLQKMIIREFVDKKELVGLKVEIEFTF